MPVTPTEPPAAAGDDKDIPEAYIEEAERFHAQCQTSRAYQRMYNCECLAARYLDQRIAGGADVPTTHIVMKINKECIDPTEEVALQHEKCLRRGPVLPAGIPVKDFCDCYADRLTGLYKEYMDAGLPRATVVQTRAMSDCRKKNYAASPAP